MYNKFIIIRENFYLQAENLSYEQNLKLQKLTINLAVSFFLLQQ